MAFFMHCDTIAIELRYYNYGCSIRNLSSGLIVMTGLLDFWPSGLLNSRPSNTSLLHCQRLDFLYAAGEWVEEELRRLFLAEELAAQ